MLGRLLRSFFRPRLRAPEDVLRFALTNYSRMTMADFQRMENGIRKFYRGSGSGPGYLLYALRLAHPIHKMTDIKKIGGRWSLCFDKAFIYTHDEPLHMEVVKTIESLVLERLYEALATQSQSASCRTDPNRFLQKLPSWEAEFTCDSNGKFFECFRTWEKWARDAKKL